MAKRAAETLAVAFPSHHLHALTGMLELDLARAAWSDAARPIRVNRIIELMFDRISGHAVTRSRIRHLASSAREWLLQRAALRLWPDNGWFQARCDTCKQDFDLPLRLSIAPRKPAKEGFPVIEVETSLGPRAFEAPNGDHEEQLSHGISTGDPARHLIGLCGLDDRAMADATLFSNDDLARIETAFETTCPDVADVIHTRCPNCATAIDARIDPLEFAFPHAQKLLREVHLIASCYHWPEREILAMPSTRRVAYAELIRTDQNRGHRL